ncbi:hypothetical protein AX17_004083 [Amanita inopinata Kibby_2008]|nr:hypothetical protein AX17_004083 [Amanita inopinata Kibby_2008]
MATTSRPASPEPPGPLPIRRLQESLINRIAAGEVIHRPASALKELLENSLDAGATSIRVTVKDGGLKLLQIQDNGCGIRKSDLPILAERFTTSKLSNYSDLSHLTTYGFRGEALASISHVSRLSVITKTKADTCAWKACYLDGALVAQKPDQSPDLRPCAGNNGTTIIIEDLFYNVPTRLSALRNTSEEYARILDLLTRYAVHNSKVMFSCKKLGSLNPDLITPPGARRPNAIRVLYSSTIAKELLDVKVSSKKRKRHSRNAEPGNGEDVKEEDPEAWSAEALFTNANYQGKKMVFLLFINHRLVDSARMKRAVEAVYNGILPKGSYPFVYLSLNIDPRAVDVNVHPTKREVHFLNEEEIIERISECLSRGLASQNQSKAFEYQTLLTGGVAVSEDTINNKRKGKEKEKEKEIKQNKQAEGTLSSSGSEVRQKTYSHHKVRMSAQDRTLDSMFPVVNPAQVESSSKKPVTRTKIRESIPYRGIEESDCSLTSINNLRQSLVKGKHKQLGEILVKHIFVGIVDLDRCLSLIQYSTNLYLVNHGALAEELFYQLGLRQFGNFNRLKLEPPPSLRDLLEIAVEAEESTKDSQMSKSQIVDRIVDMLMEKREMLSEYFSLDISASGHVESLPLLLRNYTPKLDNLPNFLMRLGPQVDWTAETECFESFCRELAYFYTPGPSPADGEDKEYEEAQEKAERWQIQYVIFPAMRHYFRPPKSLLDRDVVQIASLPDLYKVFERC